jgi:hypothetical protein
MKLLREQAWTDGALCPMLLGCHEEELHGALDLEIARLTELPNPKIVNIGCAEGYYAIGLARRLPHATVWAIDTCDEALRIATEAAGANAVNLVVGEELDKVFADPDLVVMDCEGFEVAYLDAARFPGLRQATIIVEIHNSAPENRGTILGERWNGTHTIDIVSEGARDPNRFEMLRPQPSTVRWLAMCENRPCMMQWFVMRPKPVVHQ